MLRIRFLYLDFEIPLSILFGESPFIEKKRYATIFNYHGNRFIHPFKNGS